MGWSGYTFDGRVHFHVDAHGGEREERGEQLYAECCARIDEAIKAVLADPKWEEINPFYLGA